VEKFLPTNTIWCFFDNFPWSKRGFNEKVRSHTILLVRSVMNGNVSMN